MTSAAFKTIQSTCPPPAPPCFSCYRMSQGLAQRVHFYGAQVIERVRLAVSVSVHRRGSGRGFGSGEGRGAFGLTREGGVGVGVDLICTCIGILVREWS